MTTYKVLAATRQSKTWPVWAVMALAGALLVGSFLLAREEGGDPRDVAPAEAVVVPTLVPVEDLSARCEETIAANSWADAIRACRTLQARAPDQAGLAENLAKAYVGRGEQRLEVEGDFTGAEADFAQALSYQAEFAPAQEAAARLALYLQGDKALDTAEWEDAVARFSAAYSQDPNYLQNLGERSLRGKMFMAWLRWGQSALDAGALPDAAVRCAQAQALAPDDVDARECIEAASA